MIVAIIQARLGSIRLPRKVARLIAGKTMLAHVIERTRQIPSVAEVVVATSELTADGWVVDESHRCGVRVFQGPVDDVLGRYEGVAGLLDLKPHDHIVRLTADCPLLDPRVSEQVIHLALTARVDYASNIRDWPDGLDTEVFTRRALQDAYHMATGPEDREHVTPWMRRNLFCLELPHDPFLRHVKFSVDTEEDLEYVHELVQILGPTFAWQDILTADPGRICPACRIKAPRRLRSDGRMVVEEAEREQAEILWDVHEVPCAGGIELKGCEAWEVSKRIGLRGGTICSQSLGAEILRSPSDARTSHPSGPDGGSLPGGSLPDV